MQVEQAIFTSAQTARLQGYQITAQSCRFDDSIVRELCRWCPTQSALLSADPDFDSLNCFPVDEFVAITRTVYGGPEYSGRGDLQIVTYILLVRQGQLTGYDFNPLNLALAAMAFGELRLCGDQHSSLPSISLPDKMPAAVRLPAPKTALDQIALQSVMVALTERRRVAVVGANKPLEELSFLLSRRSKDDRPTLSFASGLTPSGARPFQLHFLPSIDAAMKIQLSAQQIEVVSSSEISTPNYQI